MAGMNTPRVLLKDEAESRVMEYTPRDFPNQISKAALEFVKFQAGQENAEFKIDRVVSMTTGISELEKISLSERVEVEALERLKAMQEEAYRQGYDLGRDEGQESAYIEKTEELGLRLTQIDKVVTSLGVLKSELVKQNEASLLDLVYKIAAKISMSEIARNPEFILPVLQQAAADAQNEESILIRLSQSDFEFVEQSKARLGQEFEFVRQAKLEVSEEVSRGGCMIITNFGQIDATIEKRLEKIWASVSEKLPKRVDVIAETPGDGGEQP